MGVGFWGGQCRCDQRSEVFIRIKKNVIFFISIFFWGDGVGSGGGGRVGGGGVRVDVTEN